MTKSNRLRFNWRSKLLLLFSVFALGPTLVLSFWGMRSLDDQSQHETVQRIEGLAKARAQAVNQFTADRVRQVERIATLVVPDLEVVAKAKLAAPPPETAPAEELEDAKLLEETTAPESPDEEVPDAGVEQEEAEAPPEALSPKKPQPTPAIDLQAEAEVSLRKTLGLILWDQREYEELLIIDAEGVVVASTFQGNEGKTAANIDYFNQGKLSTFIQHVFVSPLTGKLTMVVATPIKTGEQEVLGVLAARLNLQTFFRLIGDQTGLGQTGETIVAKKVGADVVFMAPTRHDAEAALKRKVPLGSGQSMALQDAARAQISSGLSSDYRGRAVFAASQHVPVLDWGLVVKLDQKEVHSAALAARDQMIVLAVAIFVLALLCSVVISKTLVGPLRELKEATEKISKGDMDVKLAIRSRDEVGDLADSFERMVAAIKFFREDEPEGDQEEPEEGLE